MAESSRPQQGRPRVPAGLPAEPVTPTAHHNLADPPPPSSPGGEGEDGGGGDTSEQEPPRLASPRRGRRLVASDQERRASFTPEQRLLILDAWQRSGLPARDFAPLVGLSRHTLYSWKQRFEQMGPSGLTEPSPP